MSANESTTRSAAASFARVNIVAIPIANMFARFTASMPIGESSMTTERPGVEPRRLAAKRNRSGAGLPGRSCASGD